MFPFNLVNILYNFFWDTYSKLRFCDFRFFLHGDSLSCNDPLSTAMHQLRASLLSDSHFGKPFELRFKVMLSANEFMGQWFQEGIQDNQKYNASLPSQANHQRSDKYTFDAMYENVKSICDVEL